MKSDNTSDNDAKLYGLLIIIVIQVLALSYLLIDNFFVSDEPENVTILVVSGIAIPILVGLYLRSNPARLAMIAFSGISIAATTISLITRLIVLSSVMSSELLEALLTADVIPLVFTIWVVFYLTRQNVRRHFVTEKTEAEDESLSS